MPRVLIICPVTERRVPTGLEADTGPAFRRRIPMSGSVRCEACHRFHSWSRPETSLEGVPPSRRMRPSSDAHTQPRIRYLMRLVGPQGGSSTPSSR
jgi:hypothetical protein